MSPDPAVVGSDMEPLRLPAPPAFIMEVRRRGGGGAGIPPAAAPCWEAQAALTLRRLAARRLHLSSAFFSLRVRTLMCSTHWANSELGSASSGSAAGPPLDSLDAGWTLFNSCVLVNHFPLLLDAHASSTLSLDIPDIHGENGADFERVEARKSARSLANICDHLCLCRGVG